MAGLELVARQRFVVLGRRPQSLSEVQHVEPRHNVGPVRLELLEELAYFLFATHGKGSAVRKFYRLAILEERIDVFNILLEVRFMTG